MYSGFHFLCSFFRTVADSRSFMLKLCGLLEKIRHGLPSSPISKKIRKEDQFLRKFALIRSPICGGILGMQERHVCTIQRRLGQARFFLCFSLCARINFHQSAENKKQNKIKCSFRFSAWPNTKFACSYRRPSPPLDPEPVGQWLFKWPRAKGSWATFSAHQHLQGGVTFRVKRGGKRDCQRMVWPLVFW